MGLSLYGYPNAAWDKEETGCGHPEGSPLGTPGGGILVRTCKSSIKMEWG